ncbi:MAG: O-antigen ligase family protein [Candidatus Eremiobacteraeota bacterium]|nr:O-antigen ligase family protein [Candidatus Eremiobacteraeota bacterium]
MHLNPALPQTIHTIPLAPLAAIVYAALLIGTALITMRRPIGGVCILILVQPFAVYADIFGTTITLSKVALVGALLGCIAFPGAFAKLRERAPAKLLLAGVLVIAAMLLSILQAAHHMPVLREVLKGIEYLALFCVVYAAYRLEPNRRPIRIAVVAVTIAVALASLAQEILGAPSVLLVHGHATPRIAGPLEGPNQLAGYLEISLPLIFAFCIEQSEMFVHLALCLALFADVLTFSRGGGIGAIAGIATVGVVYRRRDLRDAFIYAGLGVLLGAIVAAFWGVVAHSIGLFRFWSFARVENAGGVGTRPQLWRAAFELWQRHPLLGVGAGNFELDLPLVGLNGIRTHANSLYLQALVEGGIPQLAATLYLVYVSIATFLREAAGSPLIAAALGASIALALHQIFDYLIFYPKIGGWWWILLALGVAELVRLKRTQAPCE